jgi:hypothetical protein
MKYVVKIQRINDIVILFRKIAIIKKHQRVGSEKKNNNNNNKGVNRKSRANDCDKEITRNRTKARDSIILCGRA